MHIALDVVLVAEESMLWKLLLRSAYSQTLRRNSWKILAAWPLDFKQMHVNFTKSWEIL